ncbi:DUF4357 domain-containing protein, partial [Deinococcus navajonensis]
PGQPKGRVLLGLFCNTDNMTSGSLEKVQAAVQEISEQLAESPIRNEAVVRQTIILRLLDAAGFNIWNAKEVSPEETNAAGARPDFLIKAGNGVFALEIKGSGIQFQPKDYQQVLSYASSQGIRWAILTNGRTWIVMDEKAHGKPEQREVFRIELSRENASEFAQDILQILSRRTWAEDSFAATVIELGQRIKSRNNDRSILAEKTPIVKHFQAENEIGSFNKAVELCVKLGYITDAEGQVLLGNKPENTDSKVIHFTYSIFEATARAVYKPSDGTWTVIAGSTALNRHMVIMDNGVVLRRRRYLAEGRMRLREDGLLEYVQNIVYNSPTTAAQDIVGGARNGWTSWVDSEGNLARIYKPESPVVKPRPRTKNKVAEQATE